MSISDDNFKNDFFESNYSFAHQYTGELLDIENLPEDDFFTNPIIQSFISQYEEKRLNDFTFDESSQNYHREIEGIKQSVNWEARECAITDIFLKSISSLDQLQFISANLQKFFRDEKFYPLALNTLIRQITIYAGKTFSYQEPEKILDIIKTIPNHEKANEHILESLMSSAEAIPDEILTFSIPQALWAIQYFSSIEKMDTATDYCISDLLLFSFDEEDFPAVENLYAKASEYQVDFTEKTRSNLSWEPKLIPLVDKYFPSN